MRLARGYLLVVDGCPYTFATKDVPGVIYPSGESPTGTTLVADSLAWPDVQWRESLHPTDGELEYTGFTLRLHDAAPLFTTGAAAGQSYPVSYLATRRRSALLQTPLGASFLSGDTTLTLSSGSGFPASNFTLWVDQEAVYISSRSGTTCTVSQRGYLGTRTVDHVIDYARGIFPALVYGEFPGFAMRRTRLFLVGEDGSATLLHTGYITRAPVVRGATVDLPIQSAWEVERNRSVGWQGAVTYPRGFERAAFSVNVNNVGARGFAYGDSGSAATTHVHATLEAAVRERMDEIRVAKAAEAGVSGVSADCVVNGDSLRLFLFCSGGADYVLSLSGFGVSTQRSNNADQGAGVRSADLAVPNNTSCWVLVPQGGPALDRLPITSTLGLPTSWAIATPSWVPAPYSATVRPVLVGDLGDERQLILAARVDSPISTNDTSLVPCAGPSFQCTGYVRTAYAPVSYTVPAHASAIPLTSQIKLSLATIVEAGHWAVALRTALTDTTYIDGESDPRNWSWDNFSDVLASTASGAASVQWVVDGTRKVGDLAKSVTIYNGCCLGVRAGKLSLVPLRWLLANEATTWTITGNDHANGADVSWAQNVDGLVNSVHLKGKLLDVTARDQRSINAYGEGRTVEIDVTGLVNETPAESDPYTVGVQLLQRVLGLWAEVTETVQLKVPIAPYSTLSVGDTVTLDAWLVPDGAGGRGLSATRGIVLSREPDLKDATMGLTVLLTSNAYGYAPCVRVASASGANVTVATAYMNGSDYARSDEAGYRGTASDGGTSLFLVGDKVRLLERDNTSPATQDATIVAVDPVTKKITLDSSVSASILAVLGASGTVDLIYQHYSADAATQKLYAFVGGDTVIDSTSDPTQGWSP